MTSASTAGLIVASLFLTAPVSAQVTGNGTRLVQDAPAATVSITDVMVAARSNAQADARAFRELAANTQARGTPPVQFAFADTRGPFTAR